MLLFFALSLVLKKIIGYFSLTGYVFQKYTLRFIKRKISFLRK